MTPAQVLEGLLALLAFMTLLLLAVSFMGIVAINKGNRSLDVITQAQIWNVVLAEAEKRNMGLIAVTHNRHLAGPGPQGRQLVDRLKKFHSGGPDQTSR